MSDIDMVSERFRKLSFLLFLSLDASEEIVGESLGDCSVLTEVRRFVRTRYVGDVGMFDHYFLFECELIPDFEKMVMTKFSSDCYLRVAWFFHICFLGDESWLDFVQDSFRGLRILVVQQRREGSGSPASGSIQAIQDGLKELGRDLLNQAMIPQTLSEWDRHLLWRPRMWWASAVSTELLTNDRKRMLVNMPLCFVRAKLLSKIVDSLGEIDLKQFSNGVENSPADCVARRLKCPDLLLYRNFAKVYTSKNLW